MKLKNLSLIIPAAVVVAVGLFAISRTSFFKDNDAHVFEGEKTVVAEAFSSLSEADRFAVLSDAMDQSADVCDEVVAYKYWGRYTDQKSGYFVSLTCDLGRTYMVGFEENGDLVGILPCHTARQVGQACP